MLLEESGPLLSSRHEESCFPSIHPSIHGGFTLMRDGDAAWRFRFIESSLGRCNGTRNASLLRVSPVSSPPARLFGLLLSRTRAHLPHAPHLHTYTHGRTRHADRPVSIGLQTNTRRPTTTTTTTTVHGSSRFVNPRVFFPALRFRLHFSPFRTVDRTNSPPACNLRGGPRRVFKLFASPGEIRRGNPSVCSANPGRTVLYYPAPGAPKRSTVCNRGRIVEEVAFSGKINANFNSRKNFFSFFFVLKGEGWLIEKDALQHSCVYSCVFAKGRTVYRYP